MVGRPSHQQNQKIVSHPKMLTKLIHSLEISGDRLRVKIVLGACIIISTKTFLMFIFVYKKQYGTPYCEICSIFFVSGGSKRWKLDGDQKVWNCSPVLMVRRFNRNILMPTRATLGSAGFDLYSPVNCILLPNVPATVATGIAIYLPRKTMAKIESRSSFASRGVLVLGGVIDSDYEGEVGVMLLNLSRQPINILKNEPFAQIIVSPVIIPVGLTDLSGFGIRGAGGFGSTN